jgi:hypothetical protein
LGLPYDLAAAETPHYRFRRPVVKAGGVGAGGVAASRKRAPTVEDSDVDLGDLGAGGAAAAKPEDCAAWLSQAKEIRARTQRLLDLARAHEATRAGLPPVEPGGLKMEDSEFGPWFDVAPLPVREGGANSLPAAVGGVGGPQWRYVDAWHAAGPFAVDLFWHEHGALLPDVVPVPGADSLPDAAAFRDKNGKPAQPTAAALWQAAPENGLVRPPLWDVGGEPLVGWTASYAAAEVHAGEDRELLGAAVINDTGALWINDRLVWRSGDHPFIGKTRTQVFQATLKKGRNTLIVRCEDRQRPMWFGIFFCTRGAPRDGMAARAAVAERETAYAGLKPAGHETVGWRGDRAGHYPGTNTVAAWDFARRINVVWRRPMFKATASPVLVGDNLITVNEPYFLVCVDRGTGATRWERPCSPLELKDKIAYEEMKPLHDRLIREREAALALRGESEEAKRGSRTGGIADREDGLKQAMAALEKTQKDISALSRKHGCPSYGFGHEDVANLFPTPVSDGRHVWAKLRGTVACFDLGGDRKWMVSTDSTYTPSLLLADGVLVDTDTAAEQCLFVAWDAASGREKWRARGGTPGKWLTGSPVAMRLTNGKESMVVVIGPTCDVMRLEDGRHLVRDIEFQRGSSHDHDSLVVDRDVLYVSRAMDWREAPTAEIAAFRLVMVDRDTVGAVPLWSAMVREDSFCGLTRHGEWLTQLTDGGEEGQGMLWIMEAATGRLRPPLTRLMATPIGDRWVPTCVVSDMFFLNDSWRGPGEWDWPNNMTVARMTPRPHVVARNPMERTIGTPAFAEDRIYLRTFDSLLCLGRQGDEGARYEAEVQALTALGEVSATKPDASAPVEPSPASDRFWGDTQLLWPERTVGSWTVAGPFPKRQRDAARAALGHPRWTARVGKDGTGAITVEGAEYRLDRHQTGRSFRGPWESAAWRYRPYLNVTAVLTNHANAVSYWYAEVTTDRDRLFRLDLDSPCAKLWIGGTAIGHNQRVHLAPGRYPMVMEIEVGAMPEDGVRVSSVLRDSTDPKAELEAWLDHWRFHRATLERAVRCLPGTEVAGRCAALLAELR